MLLKIVSIYDNAAGAFARPFFVQSHGQAIRSFGDEIRRAAPENELNRHPIDFCLYDLGEYDDSTGKIKQPDTPQILSRGTDFVEGK
jgi:hypothetical protein